MMATLVIAAVVLAWAIWYAGSCLVWPVRDCRMCKGRGNHRPKGNRRLSRPCWWCGQSGKRMRFGRRVWNHFAKARKAAKA